MEREQGETREFGTSREDYEAHVMMRRITALGRRRDYLAQKIREMGDGRSDFFKSELAAVEAAIWTMTFFRAMTANEGNPIRILDELGSTALEVLAEQKHSYSDSERRLHDLALQAERLVEAARAVPRMPKFEEHGQMEPRSRTYQDSRGSRDRPSNGQRRNFDRRY